MNSSSTVMSAGRLGALPGDAGKAPWETSEALQARAVLASWQPLRCALNTAATRCLIQLWSAGGRTKCGKPKGGWDGFVPGCITGQTSKERKDG